VGDVKVTREHKAQACALFPGAGTSLAAERWLAGDRVTYAVGSELHFTILAAKTIAKAEARGFAAGRAAERADVVTWLEGPAPGPSIHSVKLAALIACGQHEKVGEHG
jgi:hypothetical protein